jgi:hypothetical protein
MSEYEPGYCNIGRPQRRRRLAYAGLAFAATAVGVFGVAVGWIPRQLLIAAFVTLTIGFEMLIQAHTSFCVRLALLNRYDFRGDGGSRDRVTDSEARNADQVYATKITAISLALAAVTTGLLVLLV